MSQQWENQLQAKKHEGKVELDDNIIAQLPAGAVIKSCHGHGSSDWNQTARIDAEVDGRQISYFLKLTAGDKGGPMLHGEYESMRMIHEIIPEFSPQPLNWGECTNADLHYLLFSFHDLRDGLPDVDRLSDAVAQLHTKSKNDNTKWGFHMTTYNGPLAQDNDWSDTWEDFWIKGMRRMFAFEREARGSSEELEQLMKPYFEKVCPRLLRPLISNGRRITPVLIHGDLWPGNSAIQIDTGKPLLFDASAFWGHNEYEISYMRPINTDWGRDYMEAYHRRIPKSEPQEDWDARNALYATRVIAVNSALYIEHEHFRSTLIEEIRKLVQQFPEGYTEVIQEQPLQPQSAISTE